MELDIGFKKEIFKAYHFASVQKAIYEPQVKCQAFNRLFTNSKKCDCQCRGILTR